MCSGIQCISTNFLCSVATTINTQAENVVSIVRRGVGMVDRAITDITRFVLPRCAADVVAAIIRSSPFIAMRLFFPPPLVWAGIGAIVVYKVVTTPKGETASAPIVENGFAFAGLKIGAQQIGEGMATNSLPTALYGICNIVASLFMLLQTGFVENMLKKDETTPTAPESQSPSEPHLDAAAKEITQQTAPSTTASTTTEEAKPPVAAASAPAAAKSVEQPVAATTAPAAAEAAKPPVAAASAPAATKSTEQPVAATTAPATTVTAQQAEVTPSAPSGK